MGTGVNLLYIVAMVIVHLGREREILALYTMLVHRDAAMVEGRLWKKHWSLCILSQTVLEKEQGGGKAEVHLGQVGVHGEPRHKTIRYEQSCHLEEALVPLYPVPDCAGEGAGGGKGEVHQV